jgi:diguanylate cyclase (GGDEF)-like protein
VEDSLEDTELLLRELRRGGYDPQYERADTAEAVSAAIGRQSWDIVFGDFSMPHFSGTAALKLIREAGLDIPFIFVSGTIGEDTAVAAMKAGAQDYIMKGNLKRLIPAVQRELREAKLRQERKQAEEMIEHMAYYSPVTGLANRNRLMDRLPEAIRANEGGEHPAALILMDLDHFKEVNDTLGHRLGDRLLYEVGQKLKNALYDTDLVAHLGGDEFAVLLPRLAHAGDIEITIRKLQEALRSPFLISGIPIIVEASIGVALYPTHGPDAETLFQKADIAMYVAKRSGLGYALYAPEQDRHSPQKLALMAELRQAIEQGELILHYQPTVRLKTRRVNGVEALVRWNHRQRGMIPPDQFIGPAEQTGLIQPLTHWVLRTAMQQCSGWRKAGLGITVAVNLSPRNLLDPRLPETLEELLHSAGITPDLIRFEITESAIMTEPDRTQEILVKLREMGIRFSIDDFGVGYSSLNYLRKLPVDRIKVDRSFVTHMTQNEGDEKIVRSTTDLAHNLGLEVVAEGVETQPILDRLESMGCDEAQGYYISKPLPADDLIRWLRGSPWA